MCLCDFWISFVSTVSTEKNFKVANSGGDMAVKRDYFNVHCLEK